MRILDDWGADLPVPARARLRAARSFLALALWALTNPRTLQQYLCFEDCAGSKRLARSIWQGFGDPYGDGRRPDRERYTHVG